MFDFHSHILPGMDDGSANVDESLSLLTILAQQGVTGVAATPHFYAARESPDHFLLRRAKASQRLSARLSAGMPEILLGAEVFYYSGISHTEELDQLCLQGTAYLLLEMPFSPWSDLELREVLALQDRGIVQVVLAHVDRYWRMQRREVWDLLRQRGVELQLNAEGLLHWNNRRQYIEMLARKQIRFIGSDCHNTVSRQPKLDRAQQVLQRKRRGELLDDPWRDPRLARTYDEVLSL